MGDSPLGLSFQVLTATPYHHAHTTPEANGPTQRPHFQAPVVASRAYCGLRPSPQSKPAPSRKRPRRLISEPLVTCDSTGKCPELNHPPHPILLRCPVFALSYCPTCLPALPSPAQPRPNYPLHSVPRKEVPLKAGPICRGWAVCFSGVVPLSSTPTPWLTRYDFVVSCLASPYRTLPCPALPCSTLPRPLPCPASSAQRQRQRLVWIFATATNPAGGKESSRKDQDTYNAKPHPLVQGLASSSI